MMDVINTAPLHSHHFTDVTGCDSGGWRYERQMRNIKKYTGMQNFSLKTQNKDTRPTVDDNDYNTVSQGSNERECELTLLWFSRAPCRERLYTAMQRRDP